MLKFLRKYNKIILVVGGSILMVIFLLPTTAGSLFRDVASITVGRIGGQKVTLARLNEAGREMKVLEAMAPGIFTGLGLDRSNPEHWILLSHEAEKAGLVGGPRDAREGIDEAGFSAVAGIASPQFAERTMARLKGVIRLIESTNPTGMLSAKEAMSIGRKVFDTATLGVVVIPAATLGATLPEPDADRINEHFELYKDVDPAAPATDPTGNPYGIGYLRPRAVQIEWFGIDRMQLQTAFTPDPVEVNKYYRQNQSKYQGEFASVRTQVELEYERTHVDQMMDRAADIVRRELFRTTANLPADGPYKVLPADWNVKMPQIAALTGVVEQELVKELPSLTGATIVGTGDATWRSEQDLSFLGRVGSSYIQFARGGAMFSQYAFGIREFAGPANWALQKGLFHGPLRDASGSMYWFRVLDVRESGPPDSVDEVRARIIADIRMLDAMELLKGEAEVYRARAVADGLAKLAETAEVPAEWGFEATRQQIRRSGGGQPDPRFNVPELRDAVMALAEKMDPKANPDDIDPAERTVAIPLPSARGLVVAQVQRFRPMTAEQFRNNAVEIQRTALQDANIPQLLSAFSLERLSTRLNYKPVNTSGETEPEPAPAPAPAPAQ